MRARSSLLLCLCSAVGVSACNGFSPVRLSEVETRAGNVTTVKEVTYGDDGRIEEIETRSNGDFVGRLEFIWEGGTITELVYERANQDDLDITLNYENGRLVGMEAEQNGVDYTIDISYWKDDPGYLEEHKLVVDQGNTRTTTERTVDYDEGRAVGGREQTTVATGGGSLVYSTELELKWDKDGLPEEIEITSKGFGFTARVDAEYVFADDRRLEEVEYDNGDRVELKYDDQGRIEEVEITDGNNQTVHELSYEDGNQSGFVFVAPGLPASQLFDLTGRAFERPELFSDAWFPMP